MKNILFMDNTIDPPSPHSKSEPARSIPLKTSTKSGNIHSHLPAAVNSNNVTAPFHSSMRDFA
jgi:hypothetical protein